jgi:hypothetical protein
MTLGGDRLSGVNGASASQHDDRAGRDLPQAFGRSRSGVEGRIRRNLAVNGDDSLSTEPLQTRETIARRHSGCRHDDASPISKCLENAIQAAVSELDCDRIRERHSPWIQSMN